MKIDVKSAPSKLAPLVVLQYLEENTDENHKVTREQIKKDLSDEFLPMDRKRVVTCLQDLKQAGIEIEGVDIEAEEFERKKAEKVYLSSRDFDDSELQLLMELVLFAKHVSKKYAEDLINKLAALGTPTLREKSRTVSKLDTVYRTPKSTFLFKLDVVEEAIAVGRKLTFEYGEYAADGELRTDGKKRTVSPYYVALSEENCYLICYDEKEGGIKHYRLDKMIEPQIIRSPRKDIRETKLAGVKLNDYLASRPFMSEGESKIITLKIRRDCFEHVMYTFRGKFSKDPNVETEDWIVGTVACTEDDAFYWAMQFGQNVEVLAPQELRNRMRDAVEEMSMRYLQRDGDRYEVAVEKCERTHTLEMYGIPLKGKHKHKKLKNVASLRLADNGLTDASFIQNYFPTLHTLCIYNNPITDLDFLKDSRVRYLDLEEVPLRSYEFLAEMKHLKSLDIKTSGALDSAVFGKLQQIDTLALTCEEMDVSFLKALPLRCLWLDVERGADYSVLYQMKDLELLYLRQTVIDKLDMEKLKKCHPNAHIRSLDEKFLTGRNPSAGKHFPYPYNVLRFMFGYAKEYVGEENEIRKAVEQALSLLPESEQEVAYLYYREEKSVEEIAKTLKLSKAETHRRFYSMQGKLQKSYYNKKLKRFVQEEDLEKNRSLRDVKNHRK
ncbi:MAG: WYL domain-containing protein [Clostridia bacterium]|nr:WYL domain-containing protein [Clostridia bacterium]